MEVKTLVSADNASSNSDQYSSSFLNLTESLLAVVLLLFCDLTLSVLVSVLVESIISLL